ncbi:MAG TPA: hypothetical protein VHJ58_03855, partial [Vicinamibacterales bacterium]|nr:hypothetical protein [Vicinamibacterales bacterium]
MLMTGIAIGLVAGVAGTARGVAVRDFFPHRGDRVFAFGGESGCTVRPHNGSRNGFVCRVGGDYRARYGVIINEREAAITQYSGFNRYHVILRKRQSPLAP